MSKDVKIAQEPPGPKAAEWIRRDGLALSHLSRIIPLVGVTGHDAVIEDPDGNIYIDFGSGYGASNLGYSHPRLIKAMSAQLGKMYYFCNHGFYSPPAVELGEALVKVTPGSFAKKVFLSNSGAEAIEAALKCVRWHTKRAYIIGFINSFHGRTAGSLSFTTTNAKNRKYFPMVPGSLYVPFADCYRCPYKLDYPECDMWCLHYIEEVVFPKICDPSEIAAVLVEPIQGAGGVIVPPEGYLTELQRICERNNLILIADEIQTGFGRTGKMFNVEYEGVEPGVIALSKSIAGGLPMGATVASAEIMDWEPDSHENTLGGNPLACKAALETISILLEEKLPERAAKLGEHMLNRLREIQTRHPIVGDVRGKGLMIGVELVEDQKTKKPAKLARKIVEQALKRGLILLTAGPAVVRFLPPLIITPEQLDMGVDIFENCLGVIEQNA